MKKYLALLIILFSTPAFASDAGDAALQFINDDIRLAPSTYYDAKPFSKYFTPELKELFDETIKQELFSIKDTPKDEKPCIPDAEIFFSNVEHVSAVKILNESGNAKSKTVAVKLAYISPDSSAASDFTVLEWKAQIFLKLEKTQWLVDDISDSRWENGKTFKAILADNLKNGCYVQAK